MLGNSGPRILISHEKFLCELCLHYQGTTTSLESTRCVKCITIIFEQRLCRNTPQYYTANMDGNGSTAQNSSDEKCYPDSFNLDANAKVGQTLAYVAILVLSLVGNSLIAAVFYREKNLRTTVDFFILNMACSDILFALTVVPRRITEILSSPYEWHLDGFIGEALCRVTYIIQDVSIAVSIESLVLIAVERFRSILFPLRPNFITPSVRSISIFLTWIVAFGFHAPYIYTWRLSVQGNKTLCIYSWAPLDNMDIIMKNYFLVLSFFLFILPMVTLTILYSIIIVRLRERKVKVSSRDQKNSWNKRSRNVFRTVVAVVVVFALSWLPFNIFVYLILFYWGPQPSCIVRTVYMPYIVLLAHANNAVNPYVIFILSSNYRSGLKALVCPLKIRPCQIEANGASVIDARKVWHKSSRRLQRTTPMATSDNIEVLNDCLDTRL